MSKIYVIKRDGRKEEVLFDKITSRINKQCYDLNMTYIDPALIAISVIEGIYNGIHTKELDILAAEIAFTHTCYHPDYETLAGRLVVSNLHKETKKQFSDVINDLYNATVESTGEKLNVISKELYEIVNEHTDYLNSCIIHHRDFNYSYFGFNTLEKSYLLRINGKIVERPQHMLMRVSLGIHGSDIEKAIETYDLMSQGYFTHASPTLFTSGTNRAQMSSCFLLTMSNDERSTVMGTLKKCAIISKCAGGIGLSVSTCRKKGQLMKPRHIKSYGLIKNLRLFNVTAQYVDQGGNKRPGAIAIYVEPWHAEIFDFLNLRKNDGEKEMRCRDLFLALWIPDLFMKRVEADEDWSLMCPSECPGLNECWGTEFEKLYCKYEKEGNFVKKVKANDLFRQILIAQLETGNPFMLYKDSCNRKSNQQNLGTIKSSNLCTEIVEYCSNDEIAVCNLASIAVNKFVNVSSQKYDFDQLKSVTKFVTKNLNTIIDRNYYPLPETERSNKRHRPIGIGIQGLADAFALLHYPFESAEARLLNQQIFETLYYGALEASCELAREFGTYDTYEGSPVSRGILQYDMWNKTPTNLWNWTELKKKIALYGVRNSLLIAPMPTASTSQILGNNESFEPFKYMYYTRNVLAGEYLILNRYLVKDLIKIGLWNPEIMDKIILNYGSVQKITEIPQDIRKLYKTVWEMSIKTLMDMAADRGAFIDQSQSFTIFFNKSDLNALREIHLYGWKLGLKTGMYYLRNEAGINPQQFDMKNKDELKTLICSLTNKDECTMCSS